jgi:hypothetical protein
VSAKKNPLFIWIAALLGFAVVVYFLWPTSPKSAALTAREHLLETLGAEIAKVRPQAKVLLFSNPFAEKAGVFNEKSQFERAGISGLRKGLGKGASVTVVFPTIRPEYIANPASVSIPSDTRTPLSFLIQPESFDRLAEAHPDCTVLVSLIGLPVGVNHLKVWNQKDSRGFALLMPDLGVIGAPNEMLAAFHRGKIIAAVFEDAHTSKPLIVTQTNIASVLSAQPKILGY